MTIPRPIPRPPTQRVPLTATAPQTARLRDIAVWTGTWKGRAVFTVVVDDFRVFTTGVLGDDQDRDDARARVLHILSTDAELASRPAMLASNDKVLISAAEKLGHIVGATPLQAAAVVELVELAEQEALLAAAATGPVPIVAATDGSLAGKRGTGGYGWVTTDGRYGFGPLSPGSAVEAELEAIAHLLDDVAGRHNPDARPISIYIDSDEARKLTRNALRDGKVPDHTAGRALPRRTSSVLGKIARHSGEDVKLLNVKGHSGHPLNHAADRLAVQARRADEGDYDLHTQLGHILSDLSAAVGTPFAAAAA